MSKIFICIGCQKILTEEHSQAIENVIKIKEEFGKHVDDIDNTDLMCVECFNEFTLKEHDD